MNTNSELREDKEHNLYSLWLVDEEIPANYFTRNEVAKKFCTQILSIVDKEERANIDKVCWRCSQKCSMIISLVHTTWKS